MFSVKFTAIGQLVSTGFVIINHLGLTRESLIKILSHLNSVSSIQIHYSSSFIFTGVGEGVSTERIFKTDVARIYICELPSTIIE